MLGRAMEGHPSRFSRVMPLRLRRAPLLYTAAALALGVALSQCWRPAALLVTGTAICMLLTACALRWAPRLAVMGTMLTWLFLGWTLGVLHPRSSPDGALLPYADGLRRDVVATVVATQPLTNHGTESDQDPARFGEQAADQETPVAEAPRYAVSLQLLRIEKLDPDRVSMQNVTGTARVVLAGTDLNAPPCGAEVHATLRLYRPREFRDPGVWNYTDWLAEQNITATGNVVNGRLETLSQSHAPAQCRLQQLRTWAAGRLRRFATWQNTRARLPSAMQWSMADTAAWNAIIFGDRTALTHSLRADFERTGTFHLFVVSGMHIGLVAAAVFWLATRLRCGRLLTAGLTAVAASGYAMLTGFGQPVQRALFMTLIFLLAQAIGRERHALNAVGAAVLALLLVRPQALFDSGFRMTVLIALTIAGIAVPLLERTIAPYARACRNLSQVRQDRRLQPHVAAFRVRLRWIVTEMNAAVGWRTGDALLLGARASFVVLTATLVALITELTMALPMAVYFHRFTALALPANLLVIPLLLPLMICGIATFLLSLVAYPFAMITAVPAALLLHLAGWLVRTLGAVHGADMRTPGPALLPAVALALCAVLALVLLHRRGRLLGWAGVAAACTISLGTVLLARRLPPPHALQIAAIDVGQGDSILMIAPSGKAMLIDAGGIAGPLPQLPQQTSDLGFDTGEQVVSPYLWHRGIQRLDILALSHAHMDHLGGMNSVLRNFRPRELWLSIDAPSEPLRSLIAQARAQGTAVRFLHAGKHLDWQEVQLDVLSPDPDYTPGDAPRNDDSLVLRAVFGRSSALLAGDAEQPSEQAMLASHLLAPVTLLKVGHHGSLTSSSEPFLDALAPQVAVISCGRGNHFGHPRMPVLERLAQHGTLTARTDTMGAVEYTLEANGAVHTDVPADSR